MSVPVVDFDLNHAYDKTAEINAKIIDFVNKYASSPAVIGVLFVLVVGYFMFSTSLGSAVKNTMSQAPGPASGPASAPASPPSQSWAASALESMAWAVVIVVAVIYGLKHLFDVDIADMIL